MAYPYPNITTIGGISDLFVYANTVTANYFWSLILAAIAIITFISLKAYPTPRAFAGSAFISFACGSLLWAMGLINFMWWFGTLLMVAGAVVSLRVSGSKDLG